MDPNQVVEIRELIRSLAKEHTVILSSHILSEVSEVCDHIIIINNGVVVAEDTPENLSKKYSNQSHVSMEVKGSKEAVSQVLDNLDYIDGYSFGQENGEVLEVNLLLNTDEDKNDALFYLFAEKKMPVHKISRESLTLEEVFLKLTEQEDTEDEALVKASGEDSVKDDSEFSDDEYDGDDEYDEYDEEEE